MLEDRKTNHKLWIILIILMCCVALIKYSHNHNTTIAINTLESLNSSLNLITNGSYTNSYYIENSFVKKHNRYNFLIQLKRTLTENEKVELCIIEMILNEKDIEDCEEYLEVFLNVLYSNLYDTELLENYILLKWKKEYINNLSCANELNVLLINYILHYKGIDIEDMDVDVRDSYIYLLSKLKKIYIELAVYYANGDYDLESIEKLKMPSFAYDVNFYDSNIELLKSLTKNQQIISKSFDVDEIISIRSVIFNQVVSLLHYISSIEKKYMIEDEIEDNILEEIRLDIKKL